MPQLPHLGASASACRVGMRGRCHRQRSEYEHWMAAAHGPVAALVLDASHLMQGFRQWLCRISLAFLAVCQAGSSHLQQHQLRPDLQFLGSDVMLPDSVACKQVASRSM